MGAECYEPLLAENEKEKDVDLEILSPRKPSPNPPACTIRSLARNVIMLGFMIGLGVGLAFATWRAFPEKGSYLVTIRLRLYSMPFLRSFAQQPPSAAATQAGNELALPTTTAGKPLTNAALEHRGSQHAGTHVRKAYQLLVAFTWRWDPPQSLSDVRDQLLRLLRLKPEKQTDMWPAETGGNAAFNRYGSTDLVPGQVRYMTESLPKIASTGGITSYGSGGAGVSSGEEDVQQPKKTLRRRIVRNIWLYRIILRRVPRKVLVHKDVVDGDNKVVTTTH